MRKKNWIIIFFGCLAIGAFSFYIGNYLFGGTVLNKPNIEARVPEDTIQHLQPNIQEDDYLQTEPQELVRRDTKLIFEYYDENDGTITSAETIIPYFLVGKTREEINEYYADFEIEHFSDSEIIIRRHVQRPIMEDFVIGAVDGYIAVFYGTEMNEYNIREITDTLISPLPREDQERLQQGIAIKGENNLIRILEDYCS